MSPNPPRRCPVCRGGVTAPTRDDARAVEWHLENCFTGDDLHQSLHTLLGVSTCCEEDDHNALS